ncbi:MAG: diaminopimelate epimerase [Patescibacteria group bacterium]|jgi:diaminopimelate epimerase
MVEKRFIVYEGVGNRLIIFNDINNEYITLKNGKFLNKFNVFKKELIALLFQEKVDSMIIFYNRNHGNNFIIFEKDGSESILCGNGLRALAHFCLNDKKSQDTIVLKSILDEKFYIKRITSNSFQVRFNNVNSCVAKMNNYLAKSYRSLSYKQLVEKLNQELLPNNINYCVIGIVDVGHEPHLVIIDRSIDMITSLNKDKKRIAWKIMCKKNIFPLGININFCKISKNKKNVIFLQTYERGVNDFTLSCGTGSVCTTYALWKMLGKLDKSAKIRVMTKGGSLFVKKNASLIFYLTGSVNYLYYI